jgi:two-component system cell cycle sensor histidine kinase/response regulator CckA
MDDARRGLTESIYLSTSIKDTPYIYRIMTQPIPDWAGYIHIRIDDVTDRQYKRRAEEEEREKLIDFTDNAPVGFFSTDENGHFVFINATLSRWFGKNIEGLIGTSKIHNYMITPPSKGEAYDIKENGGERQITQAELKGPHGNAILASINQTVVKYDNGSVRTRGIVHDLRAEQEMQDALDASENRFKRFFEEAPLSIVFLDQDFKIQTHNHAFRNMMVGTEGQLESTDFSSYITPKERKTFQKNLKTFAKKETFSPFEAQLISQEDKNKTISVQLFARKLANSENIVLYCLDLTQQKNLEEQFAQSQKMQAVGQLAGGVAHDFNNLLTAIIGFCDLLLLRHKPGDPSFADIMQIQQNSNRAANLVRQLLAFSRQQTLRPEVQDLTDILIEVSHLIRRLIGANIELNLSHGDDLGLIKVDANQIEQVLVNLAVNARDAMNSNGQQNGELNITTEMFENKKPRAINDEYMPAGKWIKLNVSDTGCGIPDDVIEHIFEPFFTTKDVGEGTGLGLATVYGIIRQTGGFLEVTTKIDNGTTFSVYLPEATEEERTAEQHKPEKTVTKDLTGTARILLVEDEDPVRAFATRALTNKGYEVLDANGGVAALELLAQQKENSIDLLVTDVMMPDMDGPTVAKKIREQYPDLKIIFMSGYTEEKLKEHMGDNIWFLAKPFTLKGLAEKIKEVLG